MQVRSVRLSLQLWQALEGAASKLSRERKEEVLVSSVVRAMLEYGLMHVDQLPELGRDRRRTTAFRDKALPQDEPEKKLVAGDETDKSTAAVHAEMYERFKNIVKSKAIPPRKFIDSMGGNRKVLMEFYHSGKTPLETSEPRFWERLEEWISTSSSGM